MRTINIFETAGPTPPKPHDGYLFSEAERIEAFRQAYLNATDGKGRRLGKEKGQAAFERFEKILAGLGQGEFARGRG